MNKREKKISKLSKKVAHKIGWHQYVPTPILVTYVARTSKEKRLINVAKQVIVIALQGGLNSLPPFNGKLPNRKVVEYILNTPQMISILL